MPEARHLTLLFLGEQEENKILSLMDSAPVYPLPLGVAGFFDECLLLAHVVGCHCDLGEKEEPLRKFAEALEQYFENNGISLNHKNRWLPHVTIAREPFDREAWKSHFSPLPFVSVSLDLFASIGNLHYQSLWQMRLTPPFEKLSHTADIAFIVRGTDFRELFHHARLALAFEFPKMVNYQAETRLDSLVDVIRALNQLVTQADFDIGCPFKAVSYHGEAQKKEAYLEWEMIVDV